MSTRPEMKKQNNTTTALVLCCAVVLAVTACGTMTRKLEKQDPETNRLGLSFAHEDKTSDYIDSVYTVVMPADLDSIPDSDGNYHKIARATTDESGVSMPTWELQGVVVEQRLKNIAERNGVVNLDFIVTVPKTLINDRWQLRVYPRAFKDNSDRIDLQPLILSGADFLRMQEQGYNEYKAFVASIVPDSLYWQEMINHKGVQQALADLEAEYHKAWQNDLLLKQEWIDWRDRINKRYLLYNTQMKRNRASIDPDRDLLAILPAYWLERKLDRRSVPRTFAEYAFGNKEIVKKQITPEDSLEIEKRYTDVKRIAENERKKQEKQAMYQKLVKFPRIAARLDSIVPSGNDFKYYYTQQLDADSNTKKIKLVLNGEVVAIDQSTYEVPRSDTLTYYVSAMVDFLDEAPRYKTEVVHRRVDKVITANIDFKVGSSVVDPSLSNNASELNKVRETVDDIERIGDLVLDGLEMTGYASPEGNASYNSNLANRRTEALRQYITSNRLFGARKPSIKTMNGGENWDGLLAWSRDSINGLSAFDLADLESIVSSTEDYDAREIKLRSTKPALYEKLREEAYPSLRVTEFKFITHRAQMVQDTIHTTVIDDRYNRGRELLREREYKQALNILSEYPKDYNYAICLMSLGYDRRAYEILNTYGDRSSADVQYLLSILHVRLGHVKEAVQCLVRSAQIDHRKVFRATMDPELSKLINNYDLFHDDLNF